MRSQENLLRGGEDAPATPQTGRENEARAQPASISSSRYYRPELDVLRFFAFMFVFITHRNDLAPIDPAAHPWFHAFTLTGVYGVPVFFLLSAFLITELLERERELTGGINARAFYIRRILRIWPLYFLIFFGLVFLNSFLPGAGANSPAKWLSFMLFSGNWYITFKGWIEYPVNPMWSLSVEEQFYIAIPFLAMLGRRTLIGVNIAVLAVAYCVIVYYARGFTPPPPGSAVSGPTALSSSSSSRAACCWRSFCGAGSPIGLFPSGSLCSPSPSACGWSPTRFSGSRPTIRNRPCRRAWWDGPWCWGALRSCWSACSARHAAFCPHP
jgi:peptidoglycan/LPS O-acetylase OafA/YrhL